MTDNLSTIGSIANVIASSITGLPKGISGNLPIIVDCARQYVSQYTGVSIGSNSIPENYQYAIYYYSLSDTCNMMAAQPGGTNISLGDLSLSEDGLLQSAQNYRMMAENQIKVLGRKFGFARSLS